MEAGRGGPQTARLRPAVEVWERKRCGEREPRERDGHACVRARARSALGLGLRVYDAPLLCGRDVRKHLYIPDGLQSVHAVKGTVSYSPSISQSQARTSSH